MKQNTNKHLENIKTEWDFTNLYEKFDAEKLQKEMDKIIVEVENLVKKYTPKVEKMCEKCWLEYFQKDEEIDAKISKIFIYLNLLTAKFSQNQDYQKCSKILGLKYTDLANKTLPLQDKINNISLEKLEFLKKSEGLQKYQNYFQNLIENKKHYLGEAVENALNNVANSGAGAFVDMYDELTASFKYVVKTENGKKEMTEMEVRALRMSEKEEERKTAAKVLKNVYFTKQNQIILASAYSSVVNKWISSVKMRGYKTVMEPRNKNEELENETVDLLIESVKKYYPIYQRFLKKKAQILGKEKLQIWDLNAPISQQKTKINFEEGLEKYFEFTKKLDSEWYKMSREIFEKGRVDVFVKQGKSGGAFANYTKNIDSWVMLNHTDDLQSVFTLAHELGHAIHGQFSQNQPAQVFSSPLALAETASIFNETLFGEYLYPTLDEEEKRKYLASELDDFFATIFRQIMYISFEKRVHEAYLKGEQFSYEDFNKIWLEEWTDLVGETVEKFDGWQDFVKYGWSSIPHIFHTPFYCYTYAFGNILSLALLAKFKENPEFLTNFKEILKSGGSVRPKELLFKYGVDISNSEFYTNGLKIIEKRVVEFEKI